MIGKKCISIDWGITGIIKDELPATDKFPEQWGIYWYDISEDFIKQHGLPYYWQDKSAISYE